MIARSYPSLNPDHRTRSVFDRIFDKLDELERPRANGGGRSLTQADLTALASVLRRDAVELFGAFAQPLIGDMSGDPLLSSLAQAPGTGTVTNVSTNNTASFITFSVSNPSTTPIINVSANPANGWGTPSSTLSRATFATYAGQTISNPPTQTEVQNIDDHVKILSQRLGALITDLLTKGVLHS